MKRKPLGEIKANPESLPSWERGLKPDVETGVTVTGWVAPFVGAWIETRSTGEEIDYIKSLPSWERGLKQG